MDQQLLDLIGDVNESQRRKVETEIVFCEPPGKIEVKTPDGATALYDLKPLRELYVAGADSPSVDPQDERYMPLFMAIEGSIAGYYEQEDPGLTDGSVGLALDQLAMDPESPPAGEKLAQSIALDLRLCLSLEDYSRQEVRAALRKVRKSVERHSKIDGRRGYLDFIVEFFGPGGGY